MPLPWTRSIFSSRVISLSTSSARSSGERLVFIHGRFCFCSSSWLCEWSRAKMGATIRQSANIAANGKTKGRGLFMFWDHPVKSNLRTPSYLFLDRSASLTKMHPKPSALERVGVLNLFLHLPQLVFNPPGQSSPIPFKGGAPPSVFEGGGVEVVFALLQFALNPPDQSLPTRVHLSRTTRNYSTASPSDVPPAPVALDSHACTPVSLSS